MRSNYSKHLSHPQARRKLPYRGNLYPHRLSMGKFLGYYPKVSEPSTWIAYIKFGSGRTRQFTFAKADDTSPADGETVMSFEQAEEFARRWCSLPERTKLLVRKRVERKRPELIVCPCGPIYTVNHAIDEYLKWQLKHAAYASYLSNVYRFNRYAVQTIGTIAVDDLKPEHLHEMMHNVVATPTREYLNSVKIENPSTELDREVRRKRCVSANHVLIGVRAALEMAWDDGKVEDTSGWRRAKFYKRVAKPRVDMLTQTQCLKLLEQCEPGTRELVLGALYTGCRITELLRIQAHDICDYRMAVYVRPGKNYLTRYIALHEEGYEFFKSLAHGRGKYELIFRDQRDRPWRRNQHIKPFKRALQKAGLPRSFVFHGLRHTYASLLIQNNASPLAVARQLGHQGLQTVMKAYAHCADDFVDREIREKFVPLFNPQTQKPNEFEDIPTETMET